MFVGPTLHTVGIRKLTRIFSALIFNVINQNTEFVIINACVYIWQYIIVEVEGDNMYNTTYQIIENNKFVGNMVSRM